MTEKKAPKHTHFRLPVRIKKYLQDNGTRSVVSSAIEYASSVTVPIHLESERINIAMTDDQLRILDMHSELHGTRSRALSALVNGYLKSKNINLIGDDF